VEVWEMVAVLDDDGLSSLSFHTPISDKYL